MNAGGILLRSRAHEKYLESILIEKENIWWKRFVAYSGKGWSLGRWYSSPSTSGKGLGKG